MRLDRKYPPFDFSNAEKKEAGERPADLACSEMAELEEEWRNHPERLSLSIKLKIAQHLEKCSECQKKFL